jgi:predicted nucleic acid-binding protein
MIVLDASAAVNLLLETAAGADVARRIAAASSVNVPSHFDFEVFAALRKLTLRQVVSARDAEIALADLSFAPFRRWHSTHLTARAFELRDRLGAGDALYVALAELLEAPLVTSDRRLGSAHGHVADVDVLL